MKTPTRLRLWMVAALAFAIAAVWIWWGPDRVRETVRLPDGREVTVLAVTYGTNHALLDGPMWTKLARRFVSRPKVQQLGLRIYERTFDEPTLVVWTHWRLPPGSEAPRLASLRDRYGVESEPEHVAVNASADRTGMTLMAWQFTSFPRRQRDFPIRFYKREPERFQLLGQVLVPNTARTGGSFKTAAAPPISVKQDNVEFALSMLRSGGEVSTNLTRPHVQVAGWTEARFEVRERGELATNWTVRNLRFHGESGNQFSPLYHAVLSADGDYRVAFPDPLWVDEPNWRIRCEFARCSGFVETNRWTLKSLPAIRNIAGFTTNLSQDLVKVRIDQVGLRPGARFFPSARGGFHPTLELAVVYSPTAERWHVDLAAAADDLGRTLRFAGGFDLAKGRYLVGLEVPTNSTTLDLTFVVQQSREVEFFATPDRITTNTASPFLPSAR